ncbi:ferrous iron transport protein B [Selenomonas sp. TAMA-11512]|uniref:ferrous iron transport protein B n=1 Tax=Selenomonas sp. TAMA-11512 TaxID=3095337 RepID=UPI0030855612|nr:ferrous iron transport protein B [Selenomonas sp. TAMA-11512]
MSTMSIALAGNPNTGKSTIFNELTGLRQKIGNWPGVTVDKKMGVINHKERVISVVDLPGTYSINARSAEEKVVIDYFRESMPDFVVNVIDSSNIERNLFLTLQLLEEGAPLLLCLNMADEASRKGIRVNMRKLESFIGYPAVETVGRSSKSVKKLLDVFTTTVMRNYAPSERIEQHKLQVAELRRQGLSDEELQEKLIALRYDLIDEIMQSAVVVENVGSSVSEKIDSVLANGFLALPILLLMVYLTFQITFTWVGQVAQDALEELITGPFTEVVAGALASADVADWMQSLILDGIIGGVGAVVSFVPLIFTLFFILSILDGTGYMARVAFIMDPIMRRIGLTGKGVMPLIMGFGCGVPAIMGARALDSEKDRLTAILITPFLTCSAKLPVLALFAAMFFADEAANVVFVMYLAGVVVAILMAKALSLSVFKGESSTFLLELPPYRIPDMKTVLLETWDKGKGYLVKAGTIIFAMSVAIWFLSNFNSGGQTEDMEDSYLAAIGEGMGTIFRFHGFDNWQAGAALTTGILAKESVLSTMAVIYGIDEMADEDTAVDYADEIVAGLGGAFTPLTAIVFMVFFQLYTPCVTALGTIKKESGRWKWFGFAALYTFATAWVISLIVYLIGQAMGLA